MALRSIRKQEEEILRKKSREVVESDILLEKNQNLIDDMLETMYHYNGVGLAAVQVGMLKQIIVIDVEDGKEPYVLINPKILKTKGSKECEEGCLSFPNEFGKVIRPTEVIVEYYDRKAKKVKLKAKDGIIKVLEIQGENAKRMSIEDFLRGNSIKIGSIFKN